MPKDSVSKLGLTSLAHTLPYTYDSNAQECFWRGTISNSQSHLIGIVSIKLTIEFVCLWLFFLNQSYVRSDDMHAMAANREEDSPKKNQE